jgi:DNA-binding MarR family transcriptional regulator
LSSKTALARVPGAPADGRQSDGAAALDAVTHARLWDNPCWFAFRFNYLAKVYNAPLYGWVRRRYGLSRPEYIVIHGLGLCTRATARDLSVSYGFPKNTLSRAIHNLVRRGLIDRAARKDDRRSFHLGLTAQGRAIYDEALPFFINLQDDMLRALSPTEREQLSVLLAKVVLDTFAWAPPRDFIAGRWRDARPARRTAARDAALPAED